MEIIMKLYVLEWNSAGDYEHWSGVVGVYSSREIAELSWVSSDYNNEDYYSNITEVFLDREII